MSLSRFSNDGAGAALRPCHAGRTADGGSDNNGGRTICWAAEDEMRLWGGEQDAIVIDAGLTDGGKLSSSE